MSDWEKQFWQIAEAEGVGADIRFVQHLRDFMKQQITQAKKDEGEKVERECIHRKECIECFTDKAKKGLLPV